MTEVPDFELPASDDQTYSKAGLAGKPFVLFAYPKAMTPGCTTESCDFRDRSADFADAGITVLGISADSVERQKKFVAKHDLTMPLLADPDTRLLDPLGIWQEKKMYGKTFMGIVRSTFLVDADGEIVKEWRKVKVPGHVDEVLAAARELAG